MAVVANPWSTLRRYTPAHVGLGRAGVSLPTSVHLAFQVAHAQARDAVHDALDVLRLADHLSACGMATMRLHSAARDRAEYLRRPDLGRRLDEPSRQTLEAYQAPERADGCDLAVIVADGLSARAVQQHALPVIQRLVDQLGSQDEPWTFAPIAVVEQGRVAIGDEIGAGLGAALVLVLVGERPGLSAPDSLGAYMTWAPRQGRRDAERNCVSNIRPGGLAYDEAALRVAALLREARRRQVTGVALKDDHDVAAPVDRGLDFLLGP